MASSYDIMSMSDRTIFVNEGTIVKKSEAIITGSSFDIVSPNTIDLNTTVGSVDGYSIYIATLGETEILAASGSQLILDTILNITDEYATQSNLINSTNSLVNCLNYHLNDISSHDNTCDSISGTCNSLSTCVTLLGQIQQALIDHINNKNCECHCVVSTIPVFNSIQPTLNSCEYAYKETLKAINDHLDDSTCHLFLDTTAHTYLVDYSHVNVTSMSHNWTIYNMHTGQWADSPSDVTVKINGTEVTAQYVFGKIGAVVLPSKPAPTDTVTITYWYLVNGGSYLQTCEWESQTNQWENFAKSGIPSHKYRLRGYLVDPSNKTELLASPIEPTSVGWKYKAIEKEYAAVLNDPTSLIQNMWDGAYTALDETIKEYTTKVNNKTTSGDYKTINLPIYTDSVVSVAWRNRITSVNLTGDFTGVSVLVVNESRCALFGYLQAEPSNLKTAIRTANDIKHAFNAHILESDSHKKVDTTDTLIYADASDLDSLVRLVDELTTKLPAHSINTDYHVNADPTPTSYGPVTDLQSSIDNLVLLRSRFNDHMSVNLVHIVQPITGQVDKPTSIGMLTNKDRLEYSDGWDLYPIDFDEETSFRTYSIDGKIYLYKSGDTQPIISGNINTDISDIPIQLDELHQLVYGSIMGSSVSEWTLVMTNVNPVVDTNILKTKSVTYDGSIKPQESDPPWFNFGHSDHIIDSSELSILNSYIDENLDLTSYGYFSGYYRFEPIINEKANVAIEAEISVPWNASGISNKSNGLYINNRDIYTSLNFLYYDPISASVTGTVPSSSFINVSTYDKLSIRIDDSYIVDIVNGGPAITSLTSLVSFINSEYGDTIAYSKTVGANTYLNIRSTTKGHNSRVSIYQSEIASKTGLAVGDYYGQDFETIPQFSYSPFKLPTDLGWTKNGSQQSYVRSESLVLNDTSDSDYISYANYIPTQVDNIFESNISWSIGFMINIESYTAGDTVAPGEDLLGPIVSIDEGSSGITVDFAFTTNGLSILSYNSATSSVDYIGTITADVTNGFHSIEIMSNKSSHIILIIIDGVASAPLPLWLLNSGVGPRMISFGSGMSTIGGIDFSKSKSVSKFRSIYAFDNTNFAYSSYVDKLYVGLYKGGNPSYLDSYHYMKFDYTSNHTYRLVLSPIKTVDLFIDGSDVPSLSIQYDKISFTPSKYGILNFVSGVDRYVAFGSFDNTTVSKMVVSSVKYSVGILNDYNFTPQRDHLLNYANIITSPDHLFTTVSHGHYNTSIISNGTPSDEFLSDNSVDSYINLMKGTPIIEKTQSLEYRGGLKKTVTKTSSALPENFIYSGGYIRNFVNDSSTVSCTIDTVSNVQTSLQSEANALKAAYNIHIPDTTYHNVADGLNSITSPNSTNLASLITLLNEMKGDINNHISDTTYHYFIDSISITSPNATDLLSCITLFNDINEVYTRHIDSGKVHNYDDISDTITTPNATSVQEAAVLVQSMLIPFRYHGDETLTGFAWHHKQKDLNTGIGNSIIGLGQFRVYSTSHLDMIYVYEMNLDVGDVIRPIDGVNAGTTFTISQVIDASARLYRLSSSMVHEASNRYFEIYSGSVSSIQKSSIITILKKLIKAYDDHYINENYHYNPHGIHVDDIDFITDSDIINKSNELKYAFNEHLLYNLEHKQKDTTNVGSSIVFNDPVQNGIDCANSLKTVFNEHLGNTNSHVLSDYVNVIDDTCTSSNFISFVNNFKKLHNQHLSQVIDESNVHVTNDTTNIISTVDATDNDTALTLLNDVYHKLLTHFTQSGVHGSSVFISYSLPSRILYDRIKIWEKETGDGADLSTISDDDTLYMNGQFFNTTQTVTYGIYEGADFNTEFEYSDDHGAYTYDHKIQSTSSFEFTVVVSPDESELEYGFTMDNGKFIKLKLGITQLEIPVVRLLDANDKILYEEVFEWWMGTYIYTIDYNSNDNTIGLTINKSYGDDGGKGDDGGGK